MKEKLWHGQAIDLFYNQGKKIVEIVNIIGVTEKTISIFLKKQNPSAFEAEIEKRKKQSKQREKEAVIAWKMENKEKVQIHKDNYRAKKLGMTSEEYQIYKFGRVSLYPDELRQEHEQAVAAMSKHGMAKSISNREFEYYRSAYRQTKSGTYIRLNRTEGGAAVPEAGLKRRI